MTSISNLLLIYPVAFLVLLSGCGGFVTMNPSALKASSVVVENPLSAEEIRGGDLYKQHCASCHQSVSESTKKNRSVDQIQYAIQNIPTMKAVESLAALSPEDLQVIAQALNTSGRITFGPTCVAQPNPGHVSLHRLNRTEYNNTVRSLFGITGSPGDNLPNDTEAYGFTNIADVLTITPLSIERYLTAAQEVVDEAFSKNRAAILSCGGQALNRTCAENILNRYAAEAFRRPLSAVEVAKIKTLLDDAAKEQLNLEDGIKHALKWTLISPAFLFRSVAHPNPDNPSAVQPLNNYELASRLSYFLWSDKPDTELNNLAKSGQLAQRDVLLAQVDRMLKSPKAEALIKNFASEWLQLNKFPTHQIETNLYPFSDQLRASMATETNMLLNDVFKNDQSILKLINSDQTYLNKPLAAHYGITGPDSDTNFVPVSLSGTERRGLLGQGSILTITSASNRTSVVRRGKWILDNIFCEPPPAPPPDVTLALPGDPTGSLKERMAAHSTNPVCASCHKIIDPMGFALENFNPVGQWRQAYKDGSVIDSLGELPTGEEVEGPLTLSSFLQADPRFRKCFTKKLMIYALGRGMEEADQCTINRISQDLTGQDKKFSELVKGLVLSDPFLKQAGEGSSK